MRTPTSGLERRWVRPPGARSGQARRRLRPDSPTNGERPTHRTRAGESPRDGRYAETLVAQPRGGGVSGRLCREPGASKGSSKRRSAGACIEVQPSPSNWHQSCPPMCRKVCSPPPQLQPATSLTCVPSSDAQQESTTTSSQQQLGSSIEQRLSPAPKSIRSPASSVAQTVTRTKSQRAMSCISTHALMAVRGRPVG